MTPSTPTCTASSRLITGIIGGSGIPVRHMLTQGMNAAMNTAQGIGTRNASVMSGQYIGRNVTPARPKAWNTIGSTSASVPKIPQ